MLLSEIPFFDLRKNLTVLAVPILFLFSLTILVPTNGLGSCGLILALAWIIWKEPELRNRWWKLFWPWLLAVLVYFVMMSGYAFSKVTALRDGGEILKGISLSLIAFYILRVSEQSLRRVIEYLVIVLSVVTFAIVAFNLYQHSVMSFIHDQGFSWYVNRNRLAVGFSITSIFITVLMVNEQSRFKSIVLSILWISLCVTALLNGSRGAVLAMIVATLSIILAALFRVGWRQVFRLELWLLPTLIALSVFGWIFSQHVSLKAFFLHDGKSVDTGRFGIWQAVSERIVRAPWFGYGPHAMKYDPMIEPSRVLYQDHPHSIYVGLVYASGVVGIIFWMIWFFSFSYKIRQNFSARNEISDYLGIGFLVNILVHGLVDFDFYMFSVFTYIMVGLALMLPKFSYKE